MIVQCPATECTGRAGCPHAKHHVQNGRCGLLGCPPCVPVPMITKPVKVITIQQPYAHYCIIGDSFAEFGRKIEPDIKDVENRTWETSFRGELYIHAGKSWYGGADTRNEIRDETPEIFELMTAEMGNIIGHVNMVGCVTAHSSPWFGGPFGFVFENATKLIEYIPAKGSLGFWNATIEVPV